MKTKRTGRLALAGIFTALAVVFLLLTISPLATVGLAALAGVCGIPIVVEWGRRAGLIHFGAVALLALFLVPAIEGKGMYIAFFGWYTVFKAWVEVSPVRKIACDLSNICSLIADPFQIGNELHGCGNAAEIRCYGLLAKDQFHAKPFDLSFQTVDPLFSLRHCAESLFFSVLQECCGKLQRFAAFLTHVADALDKECKLFIEMCSHYPNLPVI